MTRTRRSAIALPALALLLALPVLPVLAAAAADPETKVKEKRGTTVVIDKSKPVRKAIEAWYALNTAAFEAKDADAIMALRTDDFHTLTPDGKTNTRADMDTRTRTFLERIERWISLDFEIGTIELDGDLASADVNQRTVRMQRFPDGSLHEVDSSVVQRETWRLTAEGPRLYRVDDIRDGALLVDGEPYSGR